MNEKILTLPLTRRTPNILLRLCPVGYSDVTKGDKKVDYLVEHPENIEQKDFDDIALPQTEVKKAQMVIMDLQKLLY